VSGTLDRDPLIGATVAGRYEVLRRIGRGGMGAIYEIKHNRLGRSFAMKTLTWEVAGNPEVVARFQREADVIASLRHPNIVEIVDWDALADGTPCLIMEFLRGEDLAQRLRKGALTWPQIARFGDEILSAIRRGLEEGEKRPPRTDRKRRPRDIWTDDMEARFQRLRDWRNRRAQEMNVEPFIVASSRMLETLAREAPDSLDALREIPDIGSWRVNDYGEEILTALKNGHPSR
jgi:hypothetical protein